MNKEVFYPDLNLISFMYIQILLYTDPFTFFLLLLSEDHIMHAIRKLMSMESTSVGSICM